MDQYVELKMPKRPGLILSRKKEEFVRIGTSIYVQVIKTKSGHMGLRIVAPDDVPIVRSQNMTTKQLNQKINSGHINILA
ncbi:MAG: hypothetical protein COA78_24835 [Blastopirellula sp.]|nr:MAG: hypothetical protein COA78_24835 [Blastopirellula sp.]